MAEYVLWQLKNDHLGEGVEMVQMATLPHMEPANVEQWTLLGPGVIVKVVLFTAIAGGVLALGVALRRGRVAATVMGAARSSASPARSTEKRVSPAMRRVSFIISWASAPRVGR